MERRDPQFDTDQSIPSFLQLIVYNYTELLRLVRMYAHLPEKKRVRGEREGFLKGILLSGFRWHVDASNLADTSTNRLRCKQVGESLTEVLAQMIAACHHLRSQFKTRKNIDDIEIFEDNLNRIVEWMNSYLAELEETSRVVALGIFLLIRKGLLNHRKLSVPYEVLERIQNSRSDTIQRVCEEIRQELEDPFADMTQFADCVLDKITEQSDRATRLLLLRSAFAIYQDVFNQPPGEDHLAFTIVQRFLPNEQDHNGIVSDQHPFANLIPPPSSTEESSPPSPD